MLFYLPPKIIHWLNCVDQLRLSPGEPARTYTGANQVEPGYHNRCMGTPSHFKRFPQLQLALMLVATLLAVLLRLPGLARGIWYDELSSIAVATAPDFLAAARAYDHPPLYFALLRWWHGWSDTIPWLRSLSVLFSVGACVIAMLWLHTRHTRATFAIGCVLATSPGLLSFSQEIRQYSLLVFLTASSCFYADRILIADRKLPSLVCLLGFTLSLSMAVATHLVAIFTLPGMVAYAAIRTRDKARIAGVLLCMLPAMLTFFYFYLFFLEARSHSYEAGWWMPAPTAQLVASNIVELLGFPQMSHGLMLFPAALVPVALCIFFSSAGLLCWAATYGNWRAALPYAALFSVSYGTIVTYSAFFISVLVSRTVLFLILPLIATVAALLGTIERKVPRAVAMSALILLCAFGATRWLVWESQKERIPWTPLSVVLEEAISQEINQEYVLTGYPFDARDMIAYKTRYKFGEHTIAPEKLACAALLPAVKSVYYVYHYRNFMPAAEVAEHESFLNGLQVCGFTPVTLYSDAGLELFWFRSQSNAAR